MDLGSTDHAHSNRGAVTPVEWNGRASGPLLEGTGSSDAENTGVVYDALGYGDDYRSAQPKGVTTTPGDFPPSLPLWNSCSNKEEALQ